jgi:hypothetical protein
MMSMTKKQRGIMVGSLIGAVLGAGVAYLMLAHPGTAQDDDEEPKPLTGSDLLSLTAAAAVLIRKFDDIRRRIT